MPVPTIALIGRTNVGKSTIFNRLLEQQKALVSDIAGTTRDRNEGNCLWRGRIIRLVDTGGLDVNLKDEVELNIKKQAELAIKLADVILFVVDLKAGSLPQEHELAEYCNLSRKPVIVVGNKAEKHSERLSVHEKEWQFPGLPEPVAISAARGTGLGDLLDVIYDKLDEIGKPAVEPEEERGTKVAVIGKPNVGKSTLLNSIIGEDRFITSPIAHTTREPNDTLVVHRDKRYIFIDTAGMRKKGKVRKSGGLEAAAVRRNEWVIRYADVTILVIDATEPIGTQEKTLAGILKNSGSSVIIVVNKWDLVQEKDVGTMNEYRKYIEASLPFIKWAPVMFVSALTGQRVKTLFDQIDLLAERRLTELNPNALGEFLQKAQRKHKPSLGKGPKAPKLLGLKQVSTAPPVFDLMIKSRRADTLHPSYTRFLENRLREEFDLEGVPVRIKVLLARSVAN
jgi:GTPase